MCRRHTLSVASVVAVLLPEPARACQPPPISIADVLPANGARDVALNSEIRVLTAPGQSEGAFAEEPEILVRPKGQAVLATRVVDGERIGGGARILLPDNGLMALTEHEVVLRGVTYPDRDGSVVERVVSTFTTGSTADTTPPTFAGLTSHSLTPEVNDSGVGCPIPEGREAYSGHRVRFQWTAASDAETDAADLRYNLYQQGVSNTLLVLARVKSATGFAFCSGGGINLADFELDKQGSYYLRAVDLAGNEDDNKKLEVFRLECANRPPDEKPLVEGQTPDSFGADDESAGCRVSATSGSPSTASGAPLFLLGLFLVRSLRWRAARARAICARSVSKPTPAGLIRGRSPG